MTFYSNGLYILFWICWIFVVEYHKFRWQSACNCTSVLISVTNQMKWLGFSHNYVIITLYFNAHVLCTVILQGKHCLMLNMRALCVSPKDNQTKKLILSVYGSFWFSTRFGSVELLSIWQSSMNVSMRWHFPKDNYHQTVIF